MLDGFITVLTTALIFGALIFIHELGHFVTARLCGIGVKEFAIGMGPRIVSWKSKKSQIEYSVRALPIGGYVNMLDVEDGEDNEAAFSNKPIWKRMLTTLAGPFMNLLFGFLIMTVIVCSQQKLASTTIGAFEENAVASEKLFVGDVIVAVDGVPVFTGNDAAYEIMNQGYEPIDITVKRNGEKIVIKDVSFSSFEESGVTFGDVDDLKFLEEERTFLNLLKHSFFRSLSTVKMIVDSLLALITGRYGLDAVSGPVGVAGVVGDAVKDGITSVLYMVTVLSMNLGVFNLIFFPALDGGRVLLLLIEAVRGKPIKREVEGYINFAGIIVLFALMILIMGKDITSLIKG